MGKESRGESLCKLDVDECLLVCGWACMSICVSVPVSLGTEKSEEKVCR